VWGPLRHRAPLGGRCEARPLAMLAWLLLLLLMLMLLLAQVSDAGCDGAEGMSHRLMNCR
jgi:hypothetical protein